MKITWKILLTGSLLLTVFLTGCQMFLPRFDGYMPLASIACKNFARNKKTIGRLEGKTIQLWGYLDTANIFPANQDSYKKSSFFLKPLANNEPGESIPVFLEGSGEEYTGLFRKLNTLAGKDRAETIVLLTGTVQTTEMSAHFNTLVGVTIHVTSSRDIRFEQDKQHVPAKNLPKT
jgi:hypothetical protein